MGFITDTHCHLNLNIFQADLAQILDRAWENGIKRILVPGIDVETSQKAVMLAEQHPNLYAAVGVHPNEALSWNAETISTLRALAHHAKVVAIGEIGLDYYREHAPHPLQQEIFQAQLALAADLGLPVVIHHRESIDDLWAELQTWCAELQRNKSPLAVHPGVLHSFDGTLSMAQTAIEKGFYIGISGPVTFKNARERQKLVAELPLQYLFTETDAPYLTPHPYRGKWPNEPAYVTFVTEKIAELQGKSLETVAQVTWKNSVQLFNWGVDS